MVVEARKQGPPCKDGCIHNIPADDRELIFKNCWGIGNYDARQNYLNSCVSERPFKRKYTKKEVSLRPMRIVFNVKSGGKSFDVCRSAFQSVHGLTSKELALLLKKRKDSSTGPLPTDKRGKHVPATKIMGETLKHVHQHIRMLPVTSSHYSRIKNPQRQYAAEGLSIPALYSQYTQWMYEEHPDASVVKFSFYKEVFTKSYNIAFKHPQSDVCNYCTKLKQDIKDCHDDPEKLDDLNEQLRVHEDEYTKARDVLRSQRHSDDDDLMVIAVDLQQTLPCPKLVVNRAYYTRKMWVYNLCIYDVKAEVPTMFLWDESQGGRGADDIASCIHKWLSDNANGRKKLRIFADNCAAQNKNKTVVLMALQKIHAKLLECVEFIYMVSGHSYLPCDSCFGHIEKRLRTIGTINTPDEYAYHIKLSTKKQPNIVRMKIADFLAFSNLEHYCKWKTPTQGKGSFQKARQIKLSNEFPAGYSVKLHYSLEDTARNHVKVSLAMEGGKGKGRGKGRGRPCQSRRDFDLSQVPLERRYPGDVILVNENKLKDLELLLPYMVEFGKAWVKGVLSKQTAARSGNGHPETVTDEDVDDPDNDAMDYEDVRCLSQDY